MNPDRFNARSGVRKGGELLTAWNRFGFRVVGVIFAGVALYLLYQLTHAGRWALAEACYIEALSIYRGDNQTRPLDLSNAVRSLAVLKYEGGASDEAGRLWQEAHDLYTELQAPRGSLKARRAWRCWLDVRAICGEVGSI